MPYVYSLEIRLWSLVRLSLLSIVTFDYLGLVEGSDGVDERYTGPPRNPVTLFIWVDVVGLPSS